MSRKTPIHNGILTSDLEANGHKIIGLQADISSEQIVEAVKPELDKLDERVTMVESEVETKASASIVNLLVHRTDALQGSKADKTALESVEERVAEIEENGSGPAVEVVAPNSSAKTGQAADAKAVFDRFVQAEQAISGKANNTDLQTLIKKVSDLQDEEAAVPKIPRYSFVNGTLGEEQEGDDGDVYAYLDIAPWKVTHFVADDLLNVDVKIRVGDGGGKMRDCVLTINCASDAPTIKWGYNMFPRTDRETDFACQENAYNVYWITEYESGRFVVARWAEVV